MNRIGEHADLQDDLAGARQPRRPLDAVALAKPLALDLVFIQAPPQHEQLITPDGGLGAEIADRLGCGLLDGGKALLEGKRGEAFVIGMQVIEIDAVGILLVRLDLLDDLVLDIVQGLRIAGGPVLRAALAALDREPQFVGDAIHVEIEENRGGRAVSVGGLAQQGPDARNGRKAGSGSAHDDVSLRFRAANVQAAARLNPGSLRKRVTVSYQIVAGVYRGLWVGAEGRIAESWRNGGHKPFRGFATSM